MSDDHHPYMDRAHWQSLYADGDQFTMHMAEGVLKLFDRIAKLEAENKFLRAELTATMTETADLMDESIAEIRRLRGERARENIRSLYRRKADHE